MTSLSESSTEHVASVRAQAVTAAEARLEVYDKEESIHSDNQNDELLQPVSVPTHTPVYSSSVKPTLNERYHRQLPMLMCLTLHKLS